MSVTISQTGQPASITIVPGPGVAFGGQGAPGVGYAAAAIAPDGHLQLLRTDGSTVDVGKVGRTVARITAAGSDGTNGTPLTADVSIVVAFVPGGCCVLPGPGANLERKVINQLPDPVVVWPKPGASIDTNAAGTAVQIPVGGSVSFHSPDGVLWASS